MSQFVNDVTGVFDQLNPLNTGNVIIYFTWLVLFVFTTIAVWRSNRRWLRLLCFLVNQVFSIGMILSWTLTTILAYTYWQHSLAAVTITAGVAWWLFRDRRRRETEPGSSMRPMRNFTDASSAAPYEDVADYEAGHRG